jgi:hypothetical protein
VGYALTATSSATSAVFPATKVTTTSAARKDKQPASLVSRLKHRIMHEDSHMSAVQKHEFQIMSGDWFRQDLLQPVFGLTPEAARKYRTRGLWLENKHWRRDPANVIVFNRKEIERWMGGQL